MNKLTKAQTELWEMDELAKGTSPIHGLHPLAKLAEIGRASCRERV